MNKVFNFFNIHRRIVHLAITIILALLFLGEIYFYKDEIVKIFKWPTLVFVIIILLLVAAWYKNPIFRKMIGEEERAVKRTKFYWIAMMCLSIVFIFPLSIYVIQSLANQSLQALIFLAVSGILCVFCFVFGINSRDIPSKNRHELFCSGRKFLIVTISFLFFLPLLNLLNQPGFNNIDIYSKPNFLDSMSWARGIAFYAASLFYYGGQFLFLFGVIDLIYTFTNLDVVNNRSQLSPLVRETSEERHLSTLETTEVTKITKINREVLMMGNTEALTEIALRDIKQGEGQRVEFKKSFAEEDEGIRSLCAFANSQGGSVYFGIDGTKGVVGVALGQNTIENFANKVHANTEPPMSPTIDPFICLGSNVVAVSISKADAGQVFYAFGDALIRVGKTNQKMSVAAIKERLIEGTIIANKTRLEARLIARIEERSRGNYRLVIENTGDDEARNIVLLMDGKPFESHPAAIVGDKQFNVIGPHSQVTRLLGITFSCAPPFEFEASWQDDSGQERRYRTTLTF